jgi:hypothetical protein
MNFTFNGQDYYLKTDIDDTQHVLTLNDYCNILGIFSRRERNPEFDENIIKEGMVVTESTALEVVSTHKEAYIDIGKESEEFKIKRFEDLFLALSNVPYGVMKLMQEQMVDYNYTSVFQVLMTSIKNITKDESTDLPIKLFNIPNTNKYYSYPDLDRISFEQWCNIETFGRPTKANPKDTTIIGIAASLLTPIESLDVLDMYGQVIEFDSIQSKLEYFKTTHINKVITKLKNSTNITNPYSGRNIQAYIKLLSGVPVKSNLTLIEYIKKDIDTIRNSFKGLYMSSNTGGEKVGENTQTYLEGVGWFDTIISLANNPSPIFNSPTGTLDAVKQRNAFDVLNYLNIKKQKDDAEYKDWKVKNKT